MKLPMKTHSKIIIFIVILLVILGGYTVAAYQLKLWPFTPASSTSDQNTSDPTLSPGKEAVSDGEFSDKTTDEVPVNPTLTATIDQLAQQDGKVIAKTSINTTDTSGLCSFVFSNANDKPVTQTASPTLKGDRVICGPIEIPEQSFSFLGDWVMTFRYYANNTQVSAEDTISIK